MLVSILANAPAMQESRWDAESISDRAVEDVVQSVKEALSEKGFSPRVFFVGDDPTELLQELRQFHKGRHFLSFQNLGIFQ